MTESMKLADLRRADVPGHKDDLRGWRFREVWSLDDDATVLAWAGDEGCVIHEEQCAHHPTTGEPTAKGRMAEARELFTIEQPKGTVRYFSFCGRCLTERTPNYGWEPTERDLALLATMRQVLNDVRLLGGKPISRVELTKRMARYGELAKPTELKRLLEHEKQERDEDAPDLTAYVLKVGVKA